MYYIAKPGVANSKDGTMYFSKEDANSLCFYCYSDSRDAFHTGKVRCGTADALEGPLQSVLNFPASVALNLLTCRLLW